MIFWDTLSPDIRSKIKNQLLGTLINKKFYILKSGAHAIAYITAIQLPRGEWHDLISSLAENTSHKSI